MREIKWSGIKSVTSPDEQKKLELWVRAHREEKGRDLSILEIGSYYGESTAILAQFGRVISIDLHGHPQDGFAHPEAIGQTSLGSFVGNVVRLGLIDRVFPVVSSSFLLEWLPPLDFDVIHIDACHSHDAVALDLQRASRHLATDGLLIMDDYRRPAPGLDVWEPEIMRKMGYEPWEGCVRAIDEFLEIGDFEIKEHFKGKALLRRVKSCTFG